MRSALDQLGASGVTSLLLEGGPKLAGAFLDAGEIDEVRLFIAPLLLGGRGARDPLESEGAETIADAVRALTLALRADRRRICSSPPGSRSGELFTGLVADLGEIIGVERSGEGVRLQVSSRLAAELGEGDSIAVNGVCLTATAIDGERVQRRRDERDAAAQLAGRGRPGTPVNLELAMRLEDRLGGHMVQGHVDGVGPVTAVVADGFAQPRDDRGGAGVAALHGPQGIDHRRRGIADRCGLDDRSFTVSLIPETLERTNLGRAEPGVTVNLEVDVLAKYVERLMPGGTPR